MACTDPCPQTSIPGGLPLSLDSRAGMTYPPACTTCSGIMTAIMFWKVANSLYDATVISFLGSVINPANLISPVVGLPRKDRRSAQYSARLSVESHILSSPSTTWNTRNRFGVGAKLEVGISTLPLGTRECTVLPDLPAKIGDLQCASSGVHMRLDRCAPIAAWWPVHTSKCSLPSPYLLL